MANVAYKRVSSTDQKTARQLDGLIFDEEFEDKLSGGTASRPALKACLAYVRKGDTLHVHSIDRLCRKLSDLEKIVGELTGKGIIVHFHKESLIFTGAEDSMSIFMMQMIGAVAQFEKALINERQREGIAAAKARGEHHGRKPSLTADQVAEIRLRKEGGEQVSDLAKGFGVSRQTIYESIKRVAVDRNETKG